MNKYGYVILCAAFLVIQCKPEQESKPMTIKQEKEQKVVIYQVFTRLFGNTRTYNKKWGTLEENGVGKFADFTEKALSEIRDLGVTHIWYTGVPHHAIATNYSDYGISQDDPDVIKGRAGSPYAVKDYYNVNPDLAVDPADRLEEFKALIARTHAAGLKLLIDIVPNHVARNYEGASTPEGKEPFGQSDDTSREYARDNNFYYIPGESFRVPNWENGYVPLGGDEHPLVDGYFKEEPAKWTGNGSRLAQPNFHDWYETVKINYGVRPDGSYDFDILPDEFWTKEYAEHYKFWSDKDVPNSWEKVRDICTYWLEMGVDGFRFDMAEMVPVEFWSYLNSGLKMAYPDVFLLAEVYNPALYREYLFRGKMDYLYDKVELYDSLKTIMQGHGRTENIAHIQEGLKDIEHHMLHFLENHDEQRIASPDFAGFAEAGKPAMVVSATISTAPTMIYFGQEVGEPGNEDAGFGSPTRTSIFDYIGVPHHQRWVNEKKFDGGQLSEREKDLRDFYSRLLNFTLKSKALMGNYREIHFYNKENTDGYDERLFSFTRWSDEERLIVLSNFDRERAYALSLRIPEEIVRAWDLPEGHYKMKDMLYGTELTMEVANGEGTLAMDLSPLQSYILQLQ